MTVKHVRKSLAIVRKVAEERIRQKQEADRLQQERDRQLQESMEKEAVEVLPLVLNQIISSARLGNSETHYSITVYADDLPPKAKYLAEALIKLLEAEGYSAHTQIIFHPAIASDEMPARSFLWLVITWKE